MKRIAILLAALMGTATYANAQFAPASGGETGAVLECFYECKPGPDVQGVATYQEITTLMLTNQSPGDRVANLYYFDGRETCLAHSTIELSPVDLDELNVCHSLDAGGVPPPPAGLVEIVVTDSLGDPGDGVYAWGKNVLGKFRTDNPEPFEGRVTAIGKYECRVVPAAVQPEVAVNTECQATPPFEVTPILVENTDDVCTCDGDLNGDGIVGSADLSIFSGCALQPSTGPCFGADLNCDGLIGPADLNILTCLLAGTNNCCP